MTFEVRGQFIHLYIHWVRSIVVFLHWVVTTPSGSVVNFQQDTFTTHILGILTDIINSATLLKIGLQSGHIAGGHSSRKTLTCTDCLAACYHKDSQRDSATFKTDLYRCVTSPAPIGVVWSFISHQEQDRAYQRHGGS